MAKERIEQLPIFCYYDKQRFTQFGSMDCANWYGVKVESGKKGQALYPAMGRKHVNFLNRNRLIFNAEPRAIFKSINYFYVIDGTRVHAFDSFYNQQNLTINVSLGQPIWFATLPVDNVVYNMMTDGVSIFLITESGSTITADKVTDPSILSIRPRYIAAFGNRFVVSDDNTPNFYLSTINVDGGAAACFTINGAPLFARASGVINQFAVLHSQLYIMCNFTTDVWANIVSQVIVAGVVLEFPWKINSSYNFDFGIANPNSLAVNFGRMVWLARNADGLVTFMTSDGQFPEVLSSQAINVLLENSTHPDNLSPFLTTDVNGFLYQYENTIFYRATSGKYLNIGQLDIEDTNNAIEYNFGSGTWARVIELNGERNRIQKHVYFNNTHLVTVQDDPAIYQMAGNIYHNELINPDQPNHQASDAFLKYPMRYELVTPQIIESDYTEFMEYWVEIDFVFGDQTFFRSCAPFLNTQYFVDESSTPTVPVYIVDEDDRFIIREGTNTPAFDDNHYCNLFKPYIEFLYSDDGGITFTSADLREFSPLGQYRWRMRWGELATSRNRCYKLLCVSSAPIVILGGVRLTRKISGGAY